MKREIYCCGCATKVQARLTDGAEIYPHRDDLRGLPFWKCDKCGNHVGCHHKTKERTRPLGCIPTPEIRAARKRVHALTDPLWQSNRIRRAELYAEIGKRIGRKHHTANIRSLEEADKICRAVEEIEKGLSS